MNCGNRVIVKEKEEVESLKTYNYLSEFRTETLKKWARENLGIDIQQIKNEIKNELREELGL